MYKAPQEIQTRGDKMSSHSSNNKWKKLDF